MKSIDIYKRLYKDYSKRFLNQILLSAFFAILVAGSTAAIAWLLDPAIKKIFIEKNQSLILLIPFLIVLTFSVKGIALYLAKSIMISVAEEVKKVLQSEMVKSLINADTQLIDQKHSGKFISNLTYDVNHITTLLSTAILNLFKDSLTLIALLFVMFYQNWKLSLIAMIMIPIASIVSQALGKRVKKVVTEAQEKSGSLNSYLIELFKNHQLIKIFQREEYESTRADQHLGQLKDKNKKIEIIFVRMSPIMETLTGIMIAILIYYSGKLALKDEIDVGSFFSFLAAMMLAYQPVRALSTLNIAIKQGLSAASRILPIIDNKNKITDHQDAQDINIKNSSINFKNINFRYNLEEEDVLKNINIYMPGGKMTSLVGHSGSGKSTLLKLIARFYDAQSGDILIDEQSIYKTKIKSLRNQISLVSQDTTLFDDTIRNNIAYAKKDASDEEIIAASKFSYSHEFIDKLPNKYETVIGENGVRLSGGEKQRLSIARAMIKKSPIILLDEATSSLDAETESKIQEALKILTKDKTTIVIAHRLSTILNSDQIYIIDAGNVVANGKHDDLLNRSELYKNFYEKQIRKG
ncbi:ABC transporter transmembrane domain-containing protein [Candidatus Pelagibacter sp.]|nr:ABC transporter transmembrane domain-containing protein [Candidatus Pelagibacter sp.]MDC1483447.1 ABC transporter transmembrane domain-containing protein [Pelagibacteraceae bacterium]